MQQVLIIGKVWPEPGSSAAGSRTLQLIKAFQEHNWQVAFASAAGESEHGSDLEALCVSKHSIELNSSSFDTFVKELQPGIVMFDRFTMEEQFGWRVAEQCPTALRVLDTIDLHCLRLARQQALKEKRDFTMSDLASDTAKRELAAIYRSDVSLMISGYEVELLQQYFKVDAALLHYTPFMPEPMSEAELQARPAFSERAHFVSIGNFLHDPNWDAVLYLKQEIWPRIRKQLPKAELHVYGAYPSQKVFQLHNAKEGFLIKGRADSAEDVMQKAKICLAPLRFGAGMKGKLMDAMLYGTPSITTSIGAEAMHDALDWNGAIADEAGAFADAAVKYYTDEALWKQAQRNGINIINSVFSKEEHSQLLIEKLSATQKNLREHRLNNFTGGMLMQQTAAATKYMSMWIELKNKVPGS